MTDTPRSASPNREQLILDAARRRFASYGYAKTTMDEIAEDVGMAKASLYYYYAAKDEVFRSVIRTEQEVYTAALSQIMATDVSAAEKLRSYGVYRVELTERLLNINRLNRREHDDVHSIFHDAFQAFDAQELKSLIRILNEGVKRGEFALGPVKPTALLIQHVLQALRLRLFRAREDAPGSSDINHEWRSESLLFMDVLLRGIAATK